VYLISDLSGEWTVVLTTIWRCKFRERLAVNKQTNKVMERFKLKKLSKK
jgi:G:T-mismatch repair DNA endonuclease (very short patch repair protein)